MISQLGTLLSLIALASPALAGPCAPQVLPRGGAVPPVEAYRLSPMELSIWNDASFKRRFAESYMAETEVEPTVTLDERDTMQEVLEFISSDRADRAQVLLEKERTPASSAVFDFALGNIHFQADDLERASKAYRAATDKYPKFRRAWRFLGMSHVRLNQFDKAIQPLARVIELGGSDAITFGLLAFAYFNDGQYLPAESAYRMALVLDPATMDWKIGLARSLFKQQRFAEAASLCDALIREDPKNAELWLLQANAYIGSGKTALAAQNYEIVERMGASTFDTLVNLGDIYFNDELFDLAVHYHVRALEASAPSEASQTGSGNAKRALRAAKQLGLRGALTETRELATKIQELRGNVLTDGEKKDLLKLQARIALAEGAGDEEAAILEEIVALDPLDGEALILLGQHSRRTGDPERAIFYFERAANLESWEADANVRHAQLLVEQRKYREAIKRLERAQKVRFRQHVQDYLEQVQRVSGGRSSVDL